MLEDIEDGDVGHRALDDDSVAEDETADQAVEARPTAHEPMRRMMRNRQRDDRADRAETARDDEGDPEQDRTEKSEGVVTQRRLQPEQAARTPRKLFVIFD